MPNLSATDATPTPVIPEVGGIASQGTQEPFTPPTTTILVCTTCGGRWENGKPVGTSQGEVMRDRLRAAQEQRQTAAASPVESTAPAMPTAKIEAVKCMGACSHACAVGIAAPGKNKYLFGDLSPEDPDTIAAILDCAALHTEKEDGLMPMGDRPVPLQRSVLGRIPPVF
jgi:predicted metal-binding protein